MRLVTKAGEERIWLYHNVRYEEAGTAPYVIGHALDITERVRTDRPAAGARGPRGARAGTHAALQEAEMMYRTLVEQARDAIVIVQDGQIRYANPACETLSGYSWDEFRQQPPQVGEFLAPEDRARVVGYYAQRLRGEAVPDCYEATLVRKDGQRVTVEIKPCVIACRGSRPSWRCCGISPTGSSGKRHCCKRRNWNPWACSRAALRMILITSSRPFWPISPWPSAMPTPTAKRLGA